MELRDRPLRDNRRQLNLSVVFTFNIRHLINKTSITVIIIRRELRFLYAACQLSSSVAIHCAVHSVLLIGFPSSVFCLHSEYPLQRSI